MSIMEIKQVGYSYDNKKKVLKGVNAEMEQGKLYAILGPSGCGKTTLLSYRPQLYRRKRKASNAFQIHRATRQGQ